MAPGAVPLTPRLLVQHCGVGRFSQSRVPQPYRERTGQDDIPGRGGVMKLLVPYVCA